MTTKQHPHDHDKDAKHPEKPGKDSEKQHLEKESPTRRVEFPSAAKGDEVTIGHGTQSYHVPRDGVIDLPKEAAEHVIRQGGAVLIDPIPEPSGQKVTVKHVSDPKATLAYGTEIRTGEFEIPVEIVAEIAPHGFVLVDPKIEPHPDGSRSK
jgi:hypothetical protein